MPLNVIQQTFFDKHIIGKEMQYKIWNFVSFAILYNNEPVIKLNILMPTVSEKFMDLFERYRQNVKYEDYCSCCYGHYQDVMVNDNLVSFIFCEKTKYFYVSKINTVECLM
ncbi:hypothetical protein [Samia ricini nucleopolyhedrovirus]|nr:hypothetical protein [Samia ricini nucleopolyhedrovirus]BBD51427.1 hypothetical protein [Samia ricini nucleopolyhedrovirus]